MILKEDQLARRRLWTAALPPALGVLLLWILFLLDRAFDLDYAAYGVLPRVPYGLRGILTGPLVHGDAEHVFNNSVALIVLGWCLVYFYPRVAGRVVMWSWLMSGALVWLLARPSYHIGASGVVYGLAAFLFFSGVIRRQRSVMAISLLVVFLYGSLIWGVLPIADHISWESHLWGGVTGVVLAWIYRHVAPAHMPKPIILEDEEEGAAGEDPSTDHGITVVYHTDPGDEEDEQEMKMREKLPPGRPLDDQRTDLTW